MALVIHFHTYLLKSTLINRLRFIMASLGYLIIKRAVFVTLAIGFKNLLLRINRFTRPYRTCRCCAFCANKKHPKASGALVKSTSASGKLTTRTYQTLFWILSRLKYNGYTRLCQVTRVYTKIVSCQVFFINFLFLKELNCIYLKQLSMRYNVSAILRKTSTTLGSNCVPLFFLISAIASSFESGFFL